MGLNKVIKLVYKSLVGRSRYCTIGWPDILNGVELMSYLGSNPYEMKSTIVYVFSIGSTPFSWTLKK